MRGYGKRVRDLLVENGCMLVRHGRGDHEIWTGPNAPKPFTVPVSIDSRHTANGVLKDAGLGKAF